MNKFIGHSLVVTANNYNTLKITVIITHKTKSSTSVCLVIAWKGILSRKHFSDECSTIELPSEFSYERISDSCLNL
jgi:hypothetical protein